MYFVVAYSATLHNFAPNLDVTNPVREKGKHHFLLGGLHLFNNMNLGAIILSVYDTFLYMID